MPWDGEIWWPQLCGGNNTSDIFWDYDKLMNTYTPDLPVCFQLTVLTWLSCGYLWICVPFYSIYLYTLRHNYRGGKKSVLNITKLVLSCVVVIISLADFIHTFTQQTPNYQPPLSLYIDAGIRTATFLLATVLVHIVYSVGIHSSGVVFCFWLVQALVNIVQFRSRIIHMEDEQDMFRFVTFYLSYAVIVLSFLLEWIPDIRHEHTRHDDNEKTPLLGMYENLSSSPDNITPCPELRSNFPGLMTHWWSTSYILRGYRRPLVFEDLPDILPNDNSSAIVQSFNESWDEETGSINNFTMMKALYRTCPANFWIALVCRLVASFGEFANPLLLQAVIAWVTSSDPYTWKGYVLAVALLVSNGLLAIIYHQFFKHAYISAYRMRSGLIGAVYRKALRLSHNSRRNTTVGEIVNLMSVDAQRIHDAAFDIHEFWAAPIMMVLAMIMLWNLVGASSLAGLAILLGLAPLNGAVFGRKLTQLQDVQMKQKDERIKKTNELLNSIKVLKMYAWENSFARFVKDVRTEELKSIKTQSFYSSAIFVVWLAIPFLTPLAIFIAYVLANPDKGLDPETAFVTINLSGILNWATSFVPIFISFFAQAYTSAKRLVKMLIMEELDPRAVETNKATNFALSIREATFTWGNKEEQPILKDISLNVSERKLIAVVGQVGSGKSSLVSAMLGEMQKITGSINVKGTTAYVSQQAWIQNATVRDNILFGKTYKKQRYNTLLEACALKADLKVLAAGDQTEIGEKGINLSGGQKQRISLARAIYQDQDIYLLDDPLSAVDAHVGKHIFENVIGPRGILNKKTRVLVTHGVTFLPQCDTIVVMRDGCVSEIGHYQELLQRDGAFAEFLRQYLNEQAADDLDDEEALEIERQLSQLSDAAGTDSEADFLSNRALRKRKNSGRAKSQLSQAVSTQALTEDKALLIEEEEAETGGIQWAVLKYYGSAASVKMLILVVFFLVLFIASQVATNIWLAAWTDDTVDNSTHVDTSVRLGVYTGLGLLEVVVIAGFALAIVIGGVLASEKLHSRLLERIIRAPLSFFDTTPIGRIINRFSTDMDKVDNTIPLYMRWFVYNIGTVVAVIFMVCYSTPLFLTVIIPLAILYYFIQKIYITAVRQMKRIDSIRKSPIFVNFDETLNGVSTIRAFSRQNAFIEKNDQLVNDNIRAWYPIVVSQRWLGYFLDTMGAFIVFFATIFAVLARDTITAGLVGLSVSFSMQTTWAINMMVRNMTELETHIVSAERVKEYSEVAQEKPWSIEEKKPRPDWPDEGSVVFNNYSTRYRAGLDLVLQNLNFSVLAGQKVGIVGRTGAGKSSITQGLFRIIEPAAGTIVIDSVDITQIGLHDLRSKLTIIPQDPVLFAASIRTNLDPLNEYTDDKIWEALRLAHLNTFVSGLSAELNYDVGEGGQALSVGQRQLVCLARALVRKSKILVLDEATAAVDLETDDLIQDTIRSAFKECTVITIAHRLNTIMDYDRVLVLDEGRIKEFNTPKVLLANETSIFHQMAVNAGLL